MATESKDVELRIRARDYSAKTLTEVGKALKDLGKAQDAQVAASAKGQTSARELENSYRKIEDAVKALIKQEALTRVFQNQADALEQTKKRADDARVAQKAFADSLADVGQKTAKQAAAQEKLAKAVKAADAAQVRAQTSLDRTVAKLGEYGIAVNQIGAAQKQMVAGVAGGNRMLEVQSRILDENENNIRAAAAASQAAAEREKKAAADKAAAEKQVSDALALSASRREKMLALQNQVAKANYDSTKAEQAMAVAMRKAADQAEASAKGYTTLARAVKSVRGDELAAQLRAITDPAGTATSNMGGLEKTISALVNKVNASRGPVKDFRTTIAALNQAMAGVGSIGAQIDAYRRQIDVLRAARTEYANARIAVKTLTDQMRAGGGDAAELGRQMTAAQAALRNSATAISAQVSKTRELREALRSAGVDTRNLAAAEQQLIANAQRATGAVNSLTAAYQKNGAAAERSSTGQFKFFESTRTTLSFAQRLRGELLALATAYVGLQGGVNLAKGALDAYRTTQKIEAQLGAVVGNDAKLIRKEWDYLMATANRIGFGFAEAAPAFAKFAIAAKAFGFSGDETRFVFEKFAEAARVAGQSSSEFEGILKAVEQMLSKGTIQAEELRGQLGDRLPGAFTIAAKAAGLTTAEFTKMMEQGGIGAEYVINIAREMGETYQGIDKASQGLAAAEARFANAGFEFQKAIADGGFVKAYQQFLLDLTALLKSEDGAALAKTLSEGFTKVIEIFKFLANNIELVKVAFSTLIAVGVLRWAVGIAGGIMKAAEAFIAMRAAMAATAAASAAAAAGVASVGTAATASTVATGGLMAALGGLAGVLGTLSAVAAGVGAIGLAVYSVVADAKQAKRNLDAMNAVGPGTRDTGNQKIGVPYGKQVGGPTPDPGTGGDASQRAAKALAATLEKNQKDLDRKQKTVTAKSVKDQLDARGDLIRDEYKMMRDSANTQIKDKEQLSKTLQTIDKQEKQALLIDAKKYQTENAKSGAAAANKEISLKERVKNELLRIEADLAKDQTKLDQTSTFDERRKTRLDAISHSYDKLKKSITQLSTLDKASAADATKKLNAYIGQLQAVEDQKVTLDEIKRLESELDDQQKLRENGLKKEQALYDSGLITQEQFLANTADIVKRGDSAITTAASDLQAFVDAAVKARAGILTLTQQSEIGTKTSTATAAASNSDRTINDEINKAQEAAIDALVDKRTAAETMLRAQLDLRRIGEDEYAAKVNANNEQYKQQIVALTEAMTARLEAQRAQGILDGTLNATQIASLDAQIAKTKLLTYETQNAAVQADSLQKSFAQFLGSGIDQAFDAVVESLTKIASGQQSVSEGFRNLTQGVLSFVASFLLEIGKAIAKQLILNALTNSGNPYLAAAGAAAGGVRQKHNGGVIGNGRSGVTRKADPSWFANAPRFHGGGIPGLKSNEVPAILEKGEQVLARDDPNNILNAQRPVNMENVPGTRFVLVDDRSGVPEAMMSAEGEQAQLVMLKRNSATVKSLLR